MVNKAEDYVRVDKVDFALQILKAQQNAELYKALMQIYESNILNDIERKRHCSTIKMTRAQREELCVY